MRRTFTVVLDDCLLHGLLFFGTASIHLHDGEERMSKPIQAKFIKNPQNKSS